MHTPPGRGPLTDDGLSPDETVEGMARPDVAGQMRLSTIRSASGSQFNGHVDVQLGSAVRGKLDNPADEEHGQVNGRLRADVADHLQKSTDEPSRRWHLIGLPDTVVDQARQMAEELLPTLDDDERRLRHTRAVAARATLALPAVCADERNLLLAAAWLHDIGYAPALAVTGFHPLDGAVHLTGQLWPPAVAGLVAHHSGARFLAAQRGLLEQMAPFHRSGFWQGPVADALTWADQTTSPTGRTVSAEQRIAEVLQRHGPRSHQARAHSERGPALMAAVRATEQRLAFSLSE